MRRGRFYVRLLAVLLSVTLAVGCGSAPAEYVSHYTTPTTTTTTTTAVTAPQASFVDGFDRPDTTLGLGDGWDMRTYLDRFPMDPAADGFIRGGRYTYAGDQVVYAARQFPATVWRIGTIGQWRKIRDSGEETGVALAITPNDRLITHMVHFAVNRKRWNLTVRRGAGFEPVASGNFTPQLEFGRDYLFEVSATADSVTVKVPGDEVTTPVSTAGLLGDRAFWEEYAKPTPASTVFDFDTAWAN